MQASPFNGPPMHGAANTFIAALVRCEVDRILYGDLVGHPRAAVDVLARLAIDEIWNRDQSDDRFELFNELSRSASPRIAGELVDAIELGLHELELPVAELAQ